MLSGSARDVLNRALQKYWPGRSDPILVGGITLLKPALQLMTSYRLVIQEVAGTEVVTSYTRWVESVQLREAENQEVYLTFSPRFERIWMESKKRLLDYMEQKPGQYWASKPVVSAAVQLGEKARLGRQEKRFGGGASKSVGAGISQRCGRQCHSRSALVGLGEPAPEGVGCRDRRDQ